MNQLQESDRTLLIIPCFNEELRINLELFCGMDNLWFLFVDDGSSDGTAEKIIQFIENKPQMKFFRLPANQGKGEAVRSGYFYASKHLISQQCIKWIGFWDADLATPLHEVFNMLRFAELHPTSVDAIFGSRIDRLGLNIVRSPHRHFCGRVFAFITKLIFGIKAYDSQCGAKLFKAEAAKNAFSTSFKSRWVFDIEIMLRLKKYTVIEYPLAEWHDVPGSKINIVREFPRVVFDLAKIWYYSIFSSKSG